MVKLIEVIIIRIGIVLYVTFAHIALVMFYPTGLKIQWINHMPWPYKKMWREFCADLGDG
jgi:hypothetical protein